MDFCFWNISNQWHQKLQYSCPFPPQYPINYGGRYKNQNFTLKFFYGTPFITRFHDYVKFQHLLSCFLHPLACVRCMDHLDGSSLTPSLHFTTIFCRKIYIQCFWELTFLSYFTSIQFFSEAVMCKKMHFKNHSC